METGKVKWFDEVKGYGFITMANGDDIFVHYSDIVAKGFKTLKQGQEVKFNISNADAGTKATNVSAIINS